MIELIILDYAYVQNRVTWGTGYSEPLLFRRQSNIPITESPAESPALFPMVNCTPCYPINKNILYNIAIYIIIHL